MMWILYLIVGAALGWYVGRQLGEEGPKKLDAAKKNKKVKALSWLRKIVK